MGQPAWSRVHASSVEQNRRMKTTRGTETSYYPEEEKENSIPIVAASEVGRAQTSGFGHWGCRTSINLIEANRIGLERPAREGNSPVGESRDRSGVS